MEEIFTNKIASCTIYDYPFNHTIIESYLPDKLYNGLNEQFNLLEKKLSPFKHIDSYDFKNKKATRFSLKFQKKNIDSAPVLINELFHILNSYDFKNELSKKFNLYMNIFKDSSPEIQVVKDVSGYKISPHTDTKVGNYRRKLLSMLIYLPDDNNFPHAGTELYKKTIRFNGIKPSDKQIIQNGLSKHNSFRIVKQAPYIKNNCIIFKPERNKTWHGVSKVKDNISRKTLQIFYML